MRGRLASGTVRWVRYASMSPIRSTTGSAAQAAWRPPRTVSAAVLSAAVLAGCAASPEPGTAPPETTDAGTQPLEVTVLVYNIHAGRDADGVDNLERVAELVRSSGADVALLQEVDRETERSGRVDQVAELERLSGFHGSFGRTLDYQGGGYGIAVLSRWPILSDGLHPLPVDPAQERAGGSYEPRGALAVRTAGAGDRRGAEGTLGVVNTHLDASAEDHYRRQEVEAVLTVAERLRADGWTVVGGDFNADPGTATIERMRDAGWKDAWATCGDGPGLTFSTESPVKRIDYLFLAPGLTCTSARVLESTASDHLPLLVVVRRNS